MTQSSAKACHRFNTDLCLTTGSIRFDNTVTEQMQRELWTATPQTAADDDHMFLYSDTYESSDRGFSNTEEFNTGPQPVDESVCMTGMMFDAFKNCYRDNPEKLVGLISEGLMFERTCELDGQIELCAARSKSRKIDLCAENDGGASWN